MLRGWRGTGRWTWQWIRLGGDMDGGQEGGGCNITERDGEWREARPAKWEKGREDMWVSSSVTWDRLIHIGKGMLNESGACDSTTGTDCTLIKRSCIYFPSKATLAHTQTHTSIHVRNQCHILSLLLLKLVSLLPKILFLVNVVSSRGAEMFCYCIVTWLCTWVFAAEPGAHKQLCR